MPGNPFYKTKEWYKARSQVLKRDGYKCLLCGADVRGKRKARVDHILKLTDRPDLALTLSNLRTLCVDCDAQRHGYDKINGMRRAQGRSTLVEPGCDSDGLPTDPNHPWG